jgi:hypothetical protein
MSRPLHVLRGWIRDGSRIDDSSPGYLRVGDTRFSLSDATEYSRMRGTGEPYGLDAVWFLYNCQSMSWTDYVRKCETENRPQCIFQDKIEINDWLSGKRPSVQGIKDISSDAAQSGPATASADQAPAPVPRPADVDVPRKPEASMELAIAAPERQALGEEVQFERIRPLDSVILCAVTFPDIWAKDDVIRQQDRRRPPTGGAGDPNRSGPRGVLDDSFIHPDLSAAP